MARKLRVEYEGALYHVTVRSNGGAPLFAADKDRGYLLGRIDEARERHGVRVYLYCLMGNHFHLVVETPRGNLGRFMQGILTGYGVYYNRRHQVHGHVTQGRYGAKLVEGNEYLLKLSRYVHLNPVKIKGVKTKPLAERVELLRSYPWSSFRGYAGLAHPHKMVEREPLLLLQEGPRKRRLEAYRTFVEAGVAQDDEEFQAVLGRSAQCIGGDEFRDEVEDRYTALLEKTKRPEDVALRRRSKVLGAATVLATVSRMAGIEKDRLRVRTRDCRWRAVAARMLCRYGGLTQREAAQELGLRTGVAVSCQLRQLARLLASDARLARAVRQIEGNLDKALARCKP
jgi:REP element-mobilizing transposase RayT